MPHNLSTKANPYPGKFHVGTYNTATEEMSCGEMAYKIINGFSAVEQYQLGIFHHILGGRESIATAVFRASISRPQKNAAILEAAQLHYASAPQKMTLFKRILKATIPCAKLRDRLAHWVPAEVSPPPEKAIVIFDPDKINGKWQGTTLEVSPLVYTQDELIQAYICMTQLIEAWNGFQAWSTTLNNNTLYAAEAHMLLALGSVESIGPSLI